MRVGNRVNAQFQLDSMGEVLQLLAAAAELGMLGPDELRAAEVVARAIEQRWTRPDAGVWELHDDFWTHSRLACVAGLRAMAAATATHGARLAANWSGRLTRSWPIWIRPFTRPGDGSAR